MERTEKWQDRPAGRQRNPPERLTRPARVHHWIADIGGNGSSQHPPEVCDLVADRAVETPALEGCSHNVGIRSLLSNQVNLTMTIAEPFTPKLRPHFMGERRVVIHNLTWAAYRQIQEAIGEQRSTRLLFDQGTLEITMPLEEHETAREWISLFIRNWVIFMGLKLKTMGSTTLDREDLNRGV